MKKRGHFHKLALKTNNELHCNSYKLLRNAMILKLRKEKQRYFCQQLEEQKVTCKGAGKTLNGYLVMALRVLALLLVQRIKRKTSVTFLLASLSLLREN